MDYYISYVTYPGESYYEQMMTVTQDQKGVLFIPQPPTQGEDGIVYGNIKALDDTQCEAVFNVVPGSTCED